MHGWGNRIVSGRVDRETFNVAAEFKFRLLTLQRCEDHAIPTAQLR